MKRCICHRTNISYLAGGRPGLYCCYWRAAAAAAAADRLICRFLEPLPAVAPSGLEAEAGAVLPAVAVDWVEAEGAGPPLPMQLEPAVDSLDETDAAGHY